MSTRSTSITVERVDYSKRPDPAEEPARSTMLQRRENQNISANQMRAPQTFLWKDSRPDGGATRV
jgi:hypothetical protein